MGFALSTAGRVGTARNADGRSLAYGGHAGVVWWVLMDAIGVELQLHMNDIAGARSYDDLRLVLTINVGQTVILALFGMTL